MATRGERGIADRQRGLVVADVVESVLPVPDGADRRGHRQGRQGSSPKLALMPRSRKKATAAGSAAASSARAATSVVPHVPGLMPDGDARVRSSIFQDVHEITLAVVARNGARLLHARCGGRDCGHHEFRERPLRSRSRSADGHVALVRHLGERGRMPRELALVRCRLWTRTRLGVFALPVGGVPGQCDDDRRWGPSTLACR